MKKSPELIEITHLWIEKAEHDIINAKHTLTLHENCPYDTICFHAQQCVEKSIKALLVFIETDFKRIHDLTELLFLLPEEIQKKINTMELSILNDYAVEIRYPGIEEPLTREEAIEAVEIAEKIFNLIKININSKAGANITT